MPQTIIFPEQDVSGFAYNNAFGCYFATMPQVSEPLVIGETYRVCWDDAEHELTAFAAAFGGTEAVAVGDKIITGAASTGEKFAIAHNPSTGYMNFFALDQKTTHRVAIYQGEEEHETLIGTGTELLVYSGTMTAIANAIRAKTGNTAPIPVPDMPAEILGITTGGGSSDDVRYVTFVSHDGSVEYGKKAVALGDDCADPIARGIFATPTRESTAQYNYTFAGWATEVNGGLDANALKAVTEDRTVYANFAAVTRVYTAKFYVDGVLISEQSVRYGDTPTISDPTKVGYSFDGWDPAIGPVTGDVVYTAKWVEKITFAGGEWPDIVRVAESGNAPNVFAIGDTRTMNLGFATCEVMIIGFNHDDLADGTGKAAITIGMVGVGPTAFKCSNTGTGYKSNANIANRFASDKAALPAELTASLKTVKKKTTVFSSSQLSTATYYETLFPLGYTEVGVTLNYQWCPDDGSEVYEAVTNGLYIPSANSFWYRNATNSEGWGVASSGSSASWGVKQVRYNADNCCMKYAFCI